MRTSARKRFEESLFNADPDMLGWMIRHNINVEQACRQLQAILDMPDTDQNKALKDNAAKIAYNIGVDALDEKPSAVELDIVGRK